MNLYNSQEALATMLRQLRNEVLKPFLGRRLAVMALIWLVAVALRLLTPFNSVVLLSVAFAAGLVALMAAPPDLRDKTGLRNFSLALEAMRLKKYLTLARVSLLALQSLGAALWLAL